MDGNEEGGRYSRNSFQKKPSDLVIGSLLGHMFFVCWQTYILLLFTNKMTSYRNWAIVGSLTSTDAVKRADLIIGSNVYWVSG